MTADDESALPTPRLRKAMKVEQLARSLVILGLLGLFARQLSAWFSGGSADEPATTVLEGALLWLFVASFLGGLFLLLPLAGLLYRRAERLDRAEGLLSDDASNRRWELPAWVGWPLWAVVAAGSLFLIYMVLAHGILRHLR